jgi:hypothetical protein
LFRDRRAAPVLVVRMSRAENWEGAWKTIQTSADIRIIAVPYDSGPPGLRMGAGPNHLLEKGLGEGLQLRGRKPSVTSVRHEKEPLAEVATFMRGGPDGTHITPTAAQAVDLSPAELFPCPVDGPSPHGSPPAGGG